VQDIPLEMFGDVRMCFAGADGQSQRMDYELLHFLRLDKPGNLYRVWSKLNRGGQYTKELPITP
jgi:hypothetical protein